MTIRKNRVRKLTMEDRDIIRLLAATGTPGKRLAELFEVSPARISQIVNDYYGEGRNE
tara:strand:+ start:1083 stop:1256 length:174 start_codon:yes stop_codon:yes gene_type:complete